MTKIAIATVNCTCAPAQQAGEGARERSTRGALGTIAGESTDTLEGSSTLEQHFFFARLKVG